jgi:hypothetical protein
MADFSTQIRAQSAIQRFVAKGHRFYLSGKVISKSELDALHGKYKELFGTDLSPSKKHYRKKCGLPTASWVSAPLSKGEIDGGYIWFLLMTGINWEGHSPARVVKDAWNPQQRLVFGDYVLHLASRHRLQGGGLRWSWYIVPKVQKELEHYISYCLKQASGELGPFFDMQIKRPLHHGVRHYISRLLRRAHQSFCKIHPGKKWPARDPGLPLPFISGFKADD